MYKIIFIVIALIFFASCGRNNGNNNAYEVRKDSFGCSYRLPVAAAFHPRYVINNNWCQCSYVNNSYVWSYRGGIRF
jgi:hypothetical protein